MFLAVPRGIYYNGFMDIERGSWVEADAYGETIRRRVVAAEHRTI